MSALVFSFKKKKKVKVVEAGTVPEFLRLSSVLVVPLLPEGLSDHPGTPPILSSKTGNN